MKTNWTLTPGSNGWTNCARIAQMRKRNECGRLSMNTGGKQKRKHTVRWDYRLETIFVRHRTRTQPVRRHRITVVSVSSSYPYSWYLSRRHAISVSRVQAPLKYPSLMSHCEMYQEYG